MRHYNWCDEQAAMSSVAYACIYIAITTIDPPNHIVGHGTTHLADEEERDSFV